MTELTKLVMLAGFIVLGLAGIGNGSPVHPWKRQALDAAMQALKTPDGISASGNQDHLALGAVVARPNEATSVALGVAGSPVRPNPDTLGAAVAVQHQLSPETSLYGGMSVKPFSSNPDPGAMIGIHHQLGPNTAVYGGINGRPFSSNPSPGVMIGIGHRF